MKSNPRLRRIYRDICRGYSEAIYDRKSVIIKHLTTFDYGEAEEFEQAALEAAINRGIPTREQKSKYLIENDLWKDEDDKRLHDTKEYLDGLQNNLKTLKYKSQVTAYRKMIAEEQERYDELYNRKEKLFDLTAERVANQKVQFYYVHLSYFRDASFDKRLFTLKDIRSWDDEESWQILGEYITFAGQFDLNNVEKVALTPSFMNALSLCGDNFSAFYAKPLWQLTLWQSNLLLSGITFRNMLQNETIPPELMEDPQKLRDYVNRTAAQKALLAKTGQNGGSTGLVGAGSEDFAEMGIKDDREFLRNGNDSLLSGLKST